MDDALAPPAAGAALPVLDRLPADGDEPEAAEGHSRAAAKSLTLVSLKATGRTLVDHFREVFSEHPQLRTYRFLDEGEGDPVTLTNTELDTRARAIAATLRERMPAGGRALIISPPGLDYVASFFACLYAGVVAVPVYPPSPVHLKRTLSRLVGIVADATPAVVLAPAVVAAMAGQLAEYAPTLRELSWQPVDTVDPAAAEGWREPEIAGADIAFLQYTSGSTGRPKGVMVSHANLLHNLAAQHEMFFGTDEDPGRHLVIWLPPYHDMGLIGGLLQPAYAGFPVTIMSPLAFLKRPVRWLRAISDVEATVSGGPNFGYDLCVEKITAQEREALDLSSWKLAFNGAEPVRAETIDRFTETFAPMGFRRTAFYPCYGLAEGTLLTAAGDRRAEPVVRKLHPQALTRNVAADPGPGDDALTGVGCGRSIVDQDLVIVDPDTRTRVEAGRIGEIWVSGPSVARGYWRAPAETEEVFGAFLADTGEGPFLRTGDLGFLDGAELFVTGRRKDLIIIAGRNHYPQDIERSAECSDPALRPGCGVACSFELDNEERLLLVHEVFGNPDSTEAGRIIASIRTAVAAEHDLQVHDVVLVRRGVIPKTSSGKLQRSACRTAFLDRRLEALATWSLSAGTGGAPRSPTDLAASPVPPAQVPATPVPGPLAAPPATTPWPGAGRLPDA
jgi:phthiocerol/phenolphthiocerol synthesis type-I polyketide synthase C